MGDREMTDEEKAAWLAAVYVSASCQFGDHAACSKSPPVVYTKKAQPNLSEPPFTFLSEKPCSCPCHRQEPAG